MTGNIFCNKLSCIRFLLILAAVFINSHRFLSYAYERDTIPLKGEWSYRLKGVPPSIPAEGSIYLPGTLDEQHKSIYNPPNDNSTQLRSEFSFEGEAMYQREFEIPTHWNEKQVVLTLERTKPSEVWIDGRKIGENSRISSPQKYYIDNLEPGTHLIEIKVNNSDSIPLLVKNTSHATSGATQTNWNGILGNLFLEARNRKNIEKIEINDSNDPENTTISMILSEPLPEGIIKIKINEREIEPHILKKNETFVTIPLTIRDSDLWNGRNPILHQIEAILTDKNGNVKDLRSLETGFRKFSTKDTNFTINDAPVFLRGTVNAAVFPSTGYAPLDEGNWDNYFSTLKNYGFNHVRFHSWTPSEAAFKAADKHGFYLLVELPLWGELDRDLEFQNKFLKEEMKGIMEAYGHHPSFVMFSPGNELWGDISLMGEYMNEAKNLNPRILSTYGSNVYLGINGEIGGEDFIVGSKTGHDEESFVRGSASFVESPRGGYLNSHYPNNTFSFEKALEGIGVPVISHEVGQYQIYPDFSSIGKYSGLLKADNLNASKELAKEAGTLKKNERYVEASGKWASKLYKAEIEAAFRTKGIGGIELMCFQDYPGQGYSSVGILDPFMDSKGLISPEEWRQSYSDLTVLAKLPKYSYSSGEEVEIPFLYINFTERPDSITSIDWKLEGLRGTKKMPAGIGLMEAGTINIDIPEVSYPMKTRLTLSDGVRELNGYDVWIYPNETKEIKNIIVTQNPEEAIKMLKKGRNVILCPDSAIISNTSIDHLFVPDFWNYQIYSKISKGMGLNPSPGTLGWLIDYTHPAFAKFPTDSHTDWQWYPIVTNAHPLIIDRLPEEIDPIIEVIDNKDRNYRMAMMLECKVSKGKLILMPLDLKEIMDYPEGRWFMQSVKEYMSGKSFQPTLTLSPVQLMELLTKPSNSRKIKEFKES